MKNLVLLGLLCFNGPSNAAVIFNGSSRFVNSRIELIEYDLDGNGTFDLGFFSGGGSYPVLGVTGPATTAIAFAIDPIWGGRVAALGKGEAIGAFENQPLFGYEQLAPGGAFLLSRLPPDDPQPGDYAPFYNKFAYLGFSFEQEDGLHYGYAHVEVIAVTAARIHGVAYESEPGKAIFTSAIPEPSSSTFILLVCGGMMWRRLR